MTRKEIIMPLFFSALLVAPAITFADESVGDKVEEAASDTGRAVKKSARKVKDKTCEMVNGKMECAAKKAKHSAKNMGDKIEDATD